MLSYGSSSPKTERIILHKERPTSYIKPRRASITSARRIGVCCGGSSVSLGVCDEIRRSSSSFLEEAPTSKLDEPSPWGWAYTDTCLPMPASFSCPEAFALSAPEVVPERPSSIQKREQSKWQGAPLPIPNIYSKRKRELFSPKRLPPLRARPKKSHSNIKIRATD